MEIKFLEKVNEQVCRLQKRNYRQIETEVAQKRISWVLQNRAGVAQHLSPRQAFELFFFDYMGLQKEELEVVEESENKIVWLSRNRCPTLEACVILNLDTRQVCREAYEKSTQAFLSQLDPQLKFQRSYEEIRPYAPYCKEWIIREVSPGLPGMEPEEAG